MFIDDEGHVFNPFSIGPPSDNQRYEYKMPNAPTYPPPVFATQPPPKKHNNRSVSQGSMATKAPNNIKSVKSKMGEVAISKAINEEMAASKQLAADEKRFNAGHDSKTHVPETRAGDKKSHMSITTLMPVRQRRSSSKTSLKSHVSNVSKAVSMKSVHSTAASAAAAEKTSSKMSVHSLVKKHTQLDTTLKQQEPKDTTKSLSTNPSLASRKDAGAHQSTISRVSVKSQSNEQQDDNVSCLTHKSHASVPQSDRVSIKSKADQVKKHTELDTTLKQQEPEDTTKSLSTNPSLASRKDAGAHQSSISRVSVKSQSKEQQDDNVSRLTHKSHASVHQSDRVSIKSKADQVSVKSNATNHQADNVSHKSIKSNASTIRADKVSQISVPSKANGIQPDKPSQVRPEENKKPLLKDVAESVKKELESSMVTTKSLAEKAALISDRLKAGNEFKHNRFHTLTRMYTNTEPVKRCRQDRIALWFKDAVLS